MHSTCDRPSGGGLKLLSIVPSAFSRAKPDRPAAINCREIPTGEDTIVAQNQNCIDAAIHTRTATVERRVDSPTRREAARLL